MTQSVSFCILVLGLVVVGVCAIEGEEEHAYDPAKLNVDVETESERLKAQMEMYAKDEDLFLGRMMARDHPFVVLELGCGPAHMSEKIIKMFEYASVVCVEVNHRFVEIGTKRMKRWEDASSSMRGNKSPRFRYVEGDLTKFAEYADQVGPVDFVLIRLVLQHLSASERLTLVREAAKVLRPEGVFLALDSDLGLSDIFQPELKSLLSLNQRTNEALAKTQTKQRADDMGRQLVWLLRETGFVSVNQEIIMGSSDEFGVDVLLKAHDPNRFYACVRAGLCTEDELNAVRKEFRETFSQWKPTSEDWTSRPLWLTFLFAAHGRKSGLARAPAFIPNPRRQQQQQQQQPQQVFSELPAPLIKGEFDDV